MYIFVNKKRIEMSNYILADNQDLTRYAIENLIRENERNVVRRARDKANLIQLLTENENSTIILDYTLFNFSDEDQLLIISERFSMASWILISEDLTDKFLHKIIYSSHAFSIIFKDSPLIAIREALHSVAQGQRYISQRAMELLLETRREEEEPDILTNTELAIVKAIAQGKTTKEIATDRFSSIHTITTHRKNIFRKLKVNTAHEVIKYALRAGWIDPADFYI